MNTKLTLKLDKAVIDRAKIYAQRTNQSLSALVQNYFNFIAIEYGIEESDISPLIRELSGIIELDTNFNEKDEYHEHIMEKYSSC